MNAIQPNESRSLCSRIHVSPAVQTVASGVSTVGSVTTGLLMLSGTIAVNAIPIAGQAICITLVVIWIIASLVSYFKGVDRWDTQAMQEAFQQKDIQILHPTPQPSDVEMVPLTSTVGETSVDEDGDVPGASQYFAPAASVRKQGDEEPGVELTPFPYKPSIRRLPPPNMITFADLHASIGREIQRQTAAAAAAKESDTEQPGNDPVVPALKLNGVIVEDVTGQETERERKPLFFPASQERTPDHLSLVPFVAPGSAPIVECPDTPKESDNWMLVRVESPRVDGPRVVEITEEEFQALKGVEAVRAGMAARKKRKGLNGQAPKVSYPAIEAPVISVNPETLKSRELLAQMAKEREARQKKPVGTLEPFTIQVRPATPEAPESPVPVSRCGQLQQKAWDVLERGQNLLSRGLDSLPTWVFERVEV